MKKSFISLVLFLLFFTPFWCMAQETKTLFLSGTDKDNTCEWQFFCTDGAQSKKWTTIAVPSCWELQGFGHYAYGFSGDAPNEQGFYRTTFKVPDDWNEKRVYIVFEGVMTDAEVTINGKLAGPIHQGAFYRFKYDITSLLCEGDNTLEVKVSKESSNNSVNEAERRADFWIFGGIFRPVYLEAQPSTFIDHVGIDAKHTGELRADVVINGAGISGEDYTLEMAVEGYDKTDEQKVLRDGEAFLSHTSLSVDNPKQWTPETPSLYTAVFTLKKNGDVCHIYKQKFGFRTIELREKDGFYLNNVKIRFKGVNRHTFWPESGRTSSKALAIEDVNLIKDMNMNAVRMSHYPPDQYFLDVCDSLGLLVIDELAGWQTRYDGETACRLVKEMIERDVNHPSIVIWSNGNEGGFPPESRPLYKQLDIQKRCVIEPFSRYEGTDTHHYPRYQPAKERAEKGDVVYMPTESLHGLYDGGHGAGLDDYWEMILQTPTAAGQFLWDFADEAVVRHDLNDSIDAQGNWAADGILGPHHEKEGSFYTIKEIWSPIYIEKPDFKNFDGTLNIANRYYFTNLSYCQLKASLIKYKRPLTGNKALSLPVKVEHLNVSPNTEHAQLKLDLPSNWSSADVLSLTATDPYGREIYTWTWPISSAQQLVKRILPKEKRVKTEVIEDDGTLTVRTKRLKVTFDKLTGEITSAGNMINLHTGGVNELRGPRFVGISPKFAKLSYQETPEGLKVVAKYSDSQQLTWLFLPDGWLRLDYSYLLDGDFDIAGLTFDVPEKGTQGATLLADGPYHVWKNRLKGVTYGIHQKKYNNTITGESWDYPEFKGYYSHFTALQLQHETCPMTILSGTDDVYLHLFTPAKPADNCDNVYPVFPDGNISLLSCIPAIGTKGSRAEDEGPQGRKAHYNNQWVKGTAYIRLGK